MASSQPRPPAAIPSAIPKRTFPSFGVRRSSTSNVASTLSQPRTSFSTPSITTAVAASPTPATLHSNTSNTTTSGVPAGSGIPALRSLRNLLPFGPPKQQSNVPSTPSRGPFAGLGSMRKSMTASRDKDKEKERMSFSNETFTPVLSIERRPSQSQDDPPMRRSVSLSHLELNLDKPLPPPGPESKSFEHQDESVTLNPLPILRTPSPGPPLLNELSTIMEADSSGISKHIPLLTPSTGSSSSLSLPNSPSSDDPEEHTIKRPIFRPSAISNHPSSIPSNSGASSPKIETETELELSTSQIVLQVKDALSRTSWSGTDKAFVIDAETSFIQVHDSNEESSHSDSDGAPDASLLGIVDGKFGSGASSSSLPRSYLGDDEEDDTSHVNNSVLSVVNPNEHYTADDATLDLGSLDPDLRAAVVNTTANRSFTNVNFRDAASPSSVGHSSTSGKTITLSSPLRPPNHPTQQGLRSASAGSIPSLSNSSASTSAATPAKPMSAVHNPSTAHKRRPASSFLPRLRSPPPHSAPTSAKNSPSPRKMSFDSVPHNGTRRVTQAHSYVSGTMTGASSPKSPVFAPGSSRVPSAGSGASTTSGSRSGSSSGNSRTPTSAEFGGRLVSSTPLKVSKPKKGVTGHGSEHRRKSSVPVATWRHSRERGEEGNELDGIAGEVGSVGPEVRVVEASGELDDRLGENSLQKRRSGEDPGAEEWSSHLLYANRKLEDNPIMASDPRLQNEEYERDEGEIRILGSPFNTPGGRDKLGVGSRGGSPSARPYSFPSPSYSPSPSATALPSHFEPNPNRTRNLSTTDVNETTMNGPMRFSHSPNPNLYTSPHSLNPSPIFPPPGVDVVFSRRNSISEGLRDPEGEGSPSRINDTGSLSGRPSRRLPAPLKLFWGSNGSNGSSGSGGGNGSGGEEKLALAERQPSPLRSVVRVDAFGREENGNGDGTRSSFDDTVSVSRPSMESTRPSLDSYIDPLAPVRRTPEPGYQRERHGLESSTSSRPPSRLFVERARKRSMSVQEIRTEFDASGSGGGRNGSNAGNGNVSSTTLSARERLARARYGDLGGGTRPLSSMSMRTSRTENLGMSVKSSMRGGRAAAGLLEIERERNSILSGIERSVSERTGEKEMVQYRERSGSASGIGTLGRYASLRSASEYNFAGGSVSAVNLPLMQQSMSYPRPYSRIAFSEASGGSEHGRRGSGTFSAAGLGLMDSPTFTISTAASGSRETQRSSSTGATSVSQASMKEREREKEELRELREKHAVETGALLNALSDSQRCCRVLREENGELREKVADIENENERLRRVLGDLEVELERLKYSRERERGWERARMRDRGWELGTGRGINSRLSASTGPGANGWRGLATPVIKQRDTMLGHRTMPRFNWQQDLEMIQHHDESEMTARNSRSKLDNVLFLLRDEQDSRSFREEDLVNEEKCGNDDTFGASSAPNPHIHNRRPSTTSSIFLMPPPNMTMLLHDETPILPDSNRSSADIHSISGFKLPNSPVLPISHALKNNHESNHSISSNVSVSPPENISMVTGSPGSLFLKPEHEMMLDEMESLDLGRGEKSEPETWDE